MKVAPEDFGIAAGKAEDYYARVEQVQEALYADVQSFLGVPQDAGCRGFLAAFTRFDATFSRVQDTLSELHRQLGMARLRAESRLPAQNSEAR